MRWDKSQLAKWDLRLVFYNSAMPIIHTDISCTKKGSDSDNPVNSDKSLLTSEKDILTPTQYGTFSCWLTLRYFVLSGINNDEQPPIPRRGTGITQLNSHTIQTLSQTLISYTADRFTHTYNRADAAYSLRVIPFHYKKRQHTTPKSIFIIQKNILCTLPPQNTSCSLCSAGRCGARLQQRQLHWSEIGGVQSEPPVAIETTPFPGLPVGGARHGHIDNVALRWSFCWVMPGTNWGRLTEGKTNGGGSRKRWRRKNKTQNIIFPTISPTFTFKRLRSSRKKIPSHNYTCPQRFMPVMKREVSNALQNYSISNFINYDQIRRSPVEEVIHNSWLLHFLMDKGVQRETSFI